MTERHVAVLCLDTVRKDAFDEFAPRLQELADVSVDRCRAPSSWTVPSHATMFTGELPHQHGIHAHAVDFSSLSVDDTFCASFPDHRTVGVSANPFVDAALGVDALFDEFHDVSAAVPFPEGLYLREFESDRSGVGQYVDYARQALGHDHPLKSLANGASAALSGATPDFLPRTSDDGGATVAELAGDAVERSSDPCLLFCNFMDAHGPYSPTTKYDGDRYSVPRGWSSDEIDHWAYNGGDRERYEADVQYYRDLYSASIDYLDRVVSELIRRLEAADDREVTVIVTADHGENLGYEADDGGLIEHKGSLSEGLLHVPFLVRNPPEPPDPTDDGYLSLRSLPDVLEQVANDRFDPPRADSIPAELVGVGANDPPLEGEDYRYWDRMIRVVYDGDRKVEWDSLGGVERYAIDRDRPCHQRPLDGGVEYAALEERFFDVDVQTYKSGVGGDGPTDDISAVSRERLESLGYV